MRRFKLSIEIFLKNEVLDAQGKTVQRALSGLGFESVSNLRVGRQIKLDMEASDRPEAEAKAREMCARLLVNEVIENYSLELEE